jgi:uncharacterized repeat protein (TIGR01451 family)
VGSQGSVVTNPDGSYGLFLNGAFCGDGDSDAFNQVFYSSSTDGQHWSIPTTVVSTDYTFSASLAQDQALAGGTNAPLGVSAYYSGRAYGPSVVPNGDGTDTLIFSGYRSPKPIVSAGTTMGTGSTPWTVGSTDPALYRNILAVTLTPSTSPAVSTATSVTPSAASPLAGAPVTFTATVSGGATGSQGPGGTVTFSDAAGTLCSDVALSGGTATCTTVFGGGKRWETVTASYGGDANYASSSGTGGVSIVPALTLEKSTTSTGYGAAGDVIPYDYVVTNPGTVAISDVAVTDDHVSGVSCPDSTLAAGDSETCTGSYTVTQADVDAGSVANTATAAGTAPGDVAVISEPAVAVVWATDATTSLSLTKSTTATGYAAAGDTIDYQYVVTNTGSTTISDVAVTDNLVGSVSCADPTLAPGASETCTGSYTVTQGDVDAGSVTNTASASGTNPQSTDVTSNSSSVTVDAYGSLSLTKTSTATSYSAVGDTLPYQYVVTNTGPVTLSDVMVIDNLIGSVSCPDPTLAPGASETCTGSYTVTQADVNNGAVSNTATVSGANAHGVTATSDPSTVTVPETGFHISTASLPDGTVGQAYSVQLAAAGGPGPDKWKKVGMLPKGMSLSSTGVLSGTAPAIAGGYPITVSVTDAKSGKPAHNTTVQQTYTLTVDATPGPSGVTCSKLVGSATTSALTVKGCSPVNKLYKSATGTEAVLTNVGTPGTLTWNGGGTTTVLISSATQVPGADCGTKATEWLYTGSVVGASQQGVGVPAIGDPVTVPVCRLGVIAVSHEVMKSVPGQTLAL